MELSHKFPLVTSWLVFEPPVFLDVFCSFMTRVFFCHHVVNAWVSLLLRQLKMLQVVIFSEHVGGQTRT